MVITQNFLISYLETKFFDIDNLCGLKKKTSKKKSSTQQLLKTGLYTGKGWWVASRNRNRPYHPPWLARQLGNG